MVEKESQRGARHHCIVVRSIETGGIKAYKTFQRMQSGREGSPRGSHQQVEKTSLASVRLCIQKHKINLGSFEGHVPPKNSTILTMAMKIKHPLDVHISPTNERATEIKYVVADINFLTDTCFLGHLIKRIHRHIFSSYQDLTNDHTLVENLRIVMSKQK